MATLQKWQIFFFKFGVSETWSIQHPKFNSSKMPHFWRQKNRHIRQHRQLETRIQHLRHSKNLVGWWRAFLACETKLTCEENQKVQLDIKIGHEEDETRHSFFRRVENSHRFTHTIKGKTYFSTWPGFRLDVRMPPQTQKFKSARMKLNFRTKNFWHATNSPFRQIH